MWRSFLQSRYAPLLTHVSLVLLTLLLFAVLYRVPFWIAFVPAAIIQHRIGVLLHEYIHGIPFSRYRTNLAVLSIWDGLLLMFGLADLFRGTHLAHHRWLNTERDPAYHAFRGRGPTIASKVTALEGVQHVIYLSQSLRGKHPDVVASRMVLGACLSSLWLAFWILVGVPGMALKLVALLMQPYR